LEVPTMRTARDVVALWGWKLVFLIGVVVTTLVTLFSGEG
jgi:hypothetical protein